MQRKRQRSNQLICRIDAAPFSVVMGVILLVLTVTTPQPSHNPFIDLPKVGHPVSMWQADRGKAMVIAIRRDGSFLYGRAPVRPSDLLPKIRESISYGSERKVYIKADARAKYGAVAEVLDAVHAAGIEKIGILVDQNKAEGQPPQPLQ